MPARKKYSTKKYSSSSRKKGSKSGGSRAWSNSVGTRFRQQYWVNPTVGRGKSIRGNPVSSNEATSCMAVALNAFSDKTMQPRFPDGKASESVGMKYQMINEIEYTRSGTMELIFFPGLNCCVHIKNATSKSLELETNQANTAPTKIQRVTNHITGAVTFQAGTPGSVPNIVEMTQVTERAVAKWRVVSYGLLLSLVNNSEENDGWWEACRITPSNEMSDYFVSLATQDAAGDTPVGTTVVQPFNVFPHVPNLSSSEMLNQASYATGKLRNIHNVVFQLNPEYDDREFVDLAKRTLVNVDDVPAGDALAGRTGWPLDADFGSLLNNYGSAQGHGGRRLTNNLSLQSNRVGDEIVSQFIDPAFDAIFIRIHGVGSSEGRSPSRLTMHSVMNQEIVYDEKALNAKFHQASVFHKSHEMIKGSPSAAQPNLLNTNM